MREDKCWFVEFVKQVLVNFASSVIAVSIVGWMVGDATKEVGGLLGLGREGLSYASLLQMFIFSFIMAGIIVFLFHNDFTKRMMLLWRMVLVFLLAFLLALSLSMIFHWFPVGSPEAWLGFILSFSACFLICTLFMIVKTKLEDRKYHLLLSNYKAKQKEEGGD